MNGNESTASNGKQLDANRDDRDAFKRAQDAYVAAYGIANKHGSDSPEFEKGFEEFEVALTAAVVSFISTPTRPLVARNVLHALKGKLVPRRMDNSGRSTTRPAAL